MSKQVDIDGKESSETEMKSRAERCLDEGGSFREVRLSIDIQVTRDRGVPQGQTTLKRLKSNRHRDQTELRRYGPGTHVMKCGGKWRNVLYC